MKDRRFQDVPPELRDGWEPTEAGKAWVELLGPHVPEDVKRWTPDTDSGVILSDPSELLAADNAFAYAIDRAKGDRVLMPVLQVMTSTYFLSSIPHEGDCLMFFCGHGSETAEVVVWNHETHEFYGPVAYDLPTIMRLAEVADSRDELETRRSALRPCLGRWQFEKFPMTLFEGSLEGDGVWSRADDWPEFEKPKSAYTSIAGRAWWVAKALFNSNPETDHIAAQLDWTPDEAFAADDFQDLPYSALYWLWRSFFLGEDQWHQTALQRCKTSQSRLVRDAAAYVEAQGGKGDLAEWRKHAMEFVEQARNPFPASVQVGPLAFVRDDSLAGLEPPAVSVPSFKCKPGQTLNASWQTETRLAVPHPDGRRWLIDGHHEHPRAGKHPSIPNLVQALFEVDPETGEGSLFCDIPGDVTYIKWAEYLDHDRLLLINNGRLRLYQRSPSGTGRGYLLDQVQLNQEKALLMRGLNLVMGYGGVPRLLEAGWETHAERVSGVRVVDGRLKRTANIELALAHLADDNGVLVGRDTDKTVGYRLEGLSATPQPERIVFVPTAFVVPEKIWRAGPNAVLDNLGAQDVSVESAAGLCLINKLVTDPPGARRAYVGDADGIRPTEPEIEMASYALMSPTTASVGTATEAYCVDLETAVATKLFEYPSGSALEVVRDGFIVLTGSELVARSGSGDELVRVNVGEGAQLLAPIHDNAVVAMQTGSSPFVLLTLRDSELWLLGAARPDGDLAGTTYQYQAQPQWLYHITGKAPDGTVLGLRGISAALADTSYGLRLEGAFPERPWESAPEISRG